MQAKSEHTYDGRGKTWLAIEIRKKFNKAPPVAFVDAQTSKRTIRNALRNNRPFDEKDLELEP